MIARIKGLKISQASERTAVTGQEMIPFQDGERNGKIRMIEFKDMTMYIFDPTIVDGKVSQEDYDALKQAIEEGKLIYTINSKRNGLDLATEVAIVGGTIYIESPDFIKEEGTDNISQVVFDTITVDGSLNYSKEQYTTTVIKTTGDGTKVLTDNGQYVYIGNLALTNIKFKDGTNTSTYDLVTNGITFRQNSTPCVSWNTVKSGNNIYMDIRIANATASMDGLMSKEDYVELNTTIPGQIEDLKEADSNLSNRIDDLDDKIDKEIADREAEIDRIENKFDGVTDKLEEALQKEIEDRKDGDNQLQTNINNLQSTMNTELAKKVGKVTVAGSGNAVTTASISGDTLTLTKGATYNNYVHPAGSAPSKASGFYKFSTDSTSHVASVTAVTKKDITDLGIADTSSTLRLLHIGSKEDYEYVVILLWKDGEVATNRIDGLFYTIMNGSTRRQAAEAHLWFSRWAAGSDYKFILNTSQQGSGFSLVTCTYNGAKWWGLRHINDQAVNFYFDGSMSSQINPTIIKYYNKNTSTVLNAEINSSVTNEAGKLSRFDVNGDPYAFLSEVNTKVSKSGDTMTGTLTVNQTSSSIPLTLHGTNSTGYIQFTNGGAQTTEVGYTTLLGTYLYNDKLTTHPCISLGRVDSLADGASYYYNANHYSLLHEGNYADKLDPRYSPKMVYNYSEGCLVRLLNASNVDAMITVRIFGNSYYTTPPIDTVIQFYNYNTGNSIIQYSGVNNGAGFGDIKVFNYNGQVYLWFKQTQQFQSFVVHAYYSNSNDYRNMVQTITNAAMPTSGVTRTVTITPKQSIYSYDNITVGNVTSSASIKASANMVARYISFNNSDGNNAGYIGSGSPTSNDLYFISQRDNGIHISADNSTITGGINLTANTNLVSIGSTTATEKLHVVGNIKATGKVSAANGFFKESDARLKSDIKPLDYTLEQICAIPTVSFIMNDQKQIGTIAQNLEELGFEDIVTESDALKSEVKNPEQFESFTKDGEEYVKVKKVEYEMLGVLAIEGVKMLKDEIEKLKAEIETLKNKQHE